MAACGVKTSSPASPRSSWEKCYNKMYRRQYKWDQDQVYEGECFRDSLHGEGSYKWKPLGVYEGGFYSNYKEGYAILSYPDNSCFEGLFVRNQRFGPGIFTHSNGRQDAGFWAGGKLVRLSRSVDFIIPRLAPTSAAKIKLLQFRRLIPVDEEVDNLFSENCPLYERPSDCLSCPYSSRTVDPRSYFFDRVIFKRTYFLNSKYTLDDLSDDPQNWVAVNQEKEEEEEEEEKQASENGLVHSQCLCPTKEFKMKYQTPSATDICEREDGKSFVEMGLLAYFTHYGVMQGKESRDEQESECLQGIEEVEQNEKGPKILAWNRNELCILMLKEIFRYRASEGKLTFNIAKLMSGARTAFRKTGEKEKQCLEFLKTCAMGPPQSVKAMLCEYDISEELTDSRGNNSVMFAAASDQHEIIDVVLDYGADVNSFNDESLTPLNLCLLRRLAQVHDLGNWEVAFLPRETEKTEGNESEGEEWRKQVSIPSLDRTFGDGTSLHEPKELQSNTCPQEKESIGTKSKSLIISDSSSISAVPMISKSLLNAATISLFKKSASPAFPGLRLFTKIKTKIQSKIKTTEEFEKSIGPPKGDSYFFQLAPEENPEIENRKKENSREFRRMTKEEDWEEIIGEGDLYESEAKKKLQEIDDTIEKLLKRGADPNLSEAPKPSIHLGVYSKDWKIVKLLLSYGANPNIQLCSNEGLLTPLHVLVLLKSSLPCVDICDLLLNFGADPEVETLPEFAFYEAEKPFLDPSEGRTPLHLLCMRPDLEYADPENHLIKIALMLAGTCNKTRLYKGYSYLALAMWFGNLKLLKVLLDSKYFDPNLFLGNDLGTILHVLVSTEFQKKTRFETSIQICDLLLDAKANPFKRIGHPEKLAGNCIDYGYREVDAEKASRKLLATDIKESGKKSSKKTEKPEKHEKTLERDHLIDHVGVLEYLQKRAEEIKLKKKRSKTDGSTGEKSKSGRSIKLEKGEGNESKTKTGEALESVTEDQKEGNGLKMGASELWKIAGKGDEDDADAETKPKAKKAREGGGKKKSKGEGKVLKFKGRKGKLKKKKDSSPSKLKPSKTVRGKQPWTTESFPEKLRQSILKFLGDCKNLDVNELLLPYVVLRDGDLYYNIKDYGSRGKEQYSLI